MTDKITSVAFHPVKPILACGFQSGTIGFFVGKSNASPFSSWTPSVWKFDDYSITSMEWNVSYSSVCHHSLSFVIENNFRYVFSRLSATNSPAEIKKVELQF